MVGMEIASLFAKVGADVTDFSKGMKQVKDELSFAEKGMAGLQNVAKTGFAAIGVAGVAAFGAVAAGMGQAVNAAAGVEQQAANISAVFGEMAPPIADVKGLINTLALDPNLVVGVEDAGAGIQMLAQNGLTWQQIADGAARSSILLSNATGADLATSADIATNAMGIFGLQVSDLDSVVATFVNSANKSQFGVEDWGYALANAGPKAAAFGFELEDLFAAMTLTSSGFASGQTMGTSWAWMINGLVPNTEKAAGMMQELGLITEDGANAFFNADGTGKELTEVIKLLQGAFGGLTVEQQMAYSRTIFGQEAFGALSGVLALNNDELAQMIPQMTDFTAVEAGAETRTNTFSAAMAALKDTVSSVFVMVGDKLLPVLTSLARTIADFVKDNAPAVVAWAEEFALTLQSVVLWVSEALATGTLFNSKFGELPLTLQNAVTWITTLTTSVTNFLTPIIAAIAQVVKWQDVLVAVGAVILSIAIPAFVGFVAAAWPVIALFAALVAGAALLRTAWETDFGGIQTKTKAVYEYLSETFGTLLTTITTFGGEALGEIVKWATGQETEFTATQKIWEAAQESFGKAFDDMKEALTEFGDKAWREFADRFPKTAKFLSDAWDKTKEGFVKAQVVVTDSMEYLQERFSPLGQAIKDFGAGALQEIGLWATGNKTDFENTQRIWQTAQETFRTVFTDIGNKLQEWGRIAWAEFKERFPQAAEALTNAYDSIRQNFQELWDALKPLIDKVVEAFNGLVADWTSGSSDMSGALQAAQVIFDGALALIVSTVEFSVNIMVNSLTLVSQLLTGDWAGAWTTVQQIATDVLTYLDSIVETVLTTVGGLFGINKDTIKKWYDDTKKNITDWWTNFATMIGNRDWAGIGRSIMQAFNTQGILDWYTKTSEKVREWWQNFKTYLVDKDWFKYGLDIIQGLWDGIKQTWNDFTDWTGKTFQSWIDWFDKLFQFGSPSKLMHQRGQWLMEGLQGGISAAAQLPISAMDALANSVQGRVNGMLDAVKNSARNITDTINSIPPMPTMPTTPNTGGSGGTGSTGGTGGTGSTAPQQPDRGTISGGSQVAFGGKDLSLALNTLVGYVDVSDTFQDIRDFATRAKELLVGVPSSSEAGMALASLQGGALSNLSVDRVLGAIQMLVRKIDEQGLGSTFNIQQAPDASLQQQTELEELVTYLNALYG